MKEYDDITLKKVQSIELEILKDFIKLCDKHDIQYFGIAGTGIGALRHKGFIPWDDDIDVAMLRKDYIRFKEVVKKEINDKYYLLDTEEDENYPLMTSRLIKRNTKFREFSLKDVECDFGIFLDIYPLDNLADDSKALKKQAIMAWFLSKILILRSVKYPYVPFKGIKRKIIHIICTIIHYLLVVFGMSKKKIYTKCKHVCTKYNDVETDSVGFLCDTNPYWNTIKRCEIYPLVKLEYEGIYVNFPKNLHGLLKNQYGDYMQLPPVEKRKNHYPYELDFGES